MFLDNGRGEGRWHRDRQQLAEIANTGVDVYEFKSHSLCKGNECIVDRLDRERSVGSSQISCMILTKEGGERNEEDAFCNSYAGIFNWVCIEGLCETTD